VYAEVRVVMRFQGQNEATTHTTSTYYILPLVKDQTTPLRLQPQAERLSRKTTRASSCAGCGSLNLPVRRILAANDDMSSDFTLSLLPLN